MKNSNSSPAYFMNISLFALIRHFDNNKLIKVLVSLDLSQKIGEGTSQSQFLHFDAECSAYIHISRRQISLEPKREKT